MLWNSSGPGINIYIYLMICNSDSYYWNFINFKAIYGFVRVSLISWCLPAVVLLRHLLHLLPFPIFILSKLRQSVQDLGFYVYENLLSLSLFSVIFLAVCYLSISYSMDFIQLIQFLLFLVPLGTRSLVSVCLSSQTLWK